MTDDSRMLRTLKEMHRPPTPKAAEDQVLPAGEMFRVPNLSGDHSAGTTGTPVTDFQIANKKYVDDNIGGVHTESSTDSLTNKTIDDFSNKVDADEVHIQVRNESGGDMSKGDLVYISGYSIGQDKPLVSLADADGGGTFPVLAMINDSTISNNATGHATVSGRVSGLDTSAFSVGDTVYMSTTAGAFSTKPTGAGEQVQAIGVVLRSHATLGVLEVFGAGRINQSPNAGHDAFTDFAADEHFTEASIDHTAIQNIGTNTHAQIDTSITATGVNSTHVAGDGSDHADVASNTTHRNDNTQAHSDYLKNDAADVGVGLTLTSDNNTGDTQYTAQVLHGTDATPPTASNFPRGIIYIQYTA